MPDAWTAEQIAALGLAPQPEEAAPPRGEWIPAGEAAAMRMDARMVAGRRPDGGLIMGVFDFVRQAVVARHSVPVPVAEVHLAAEPEPRPPDPYAGAWEPGTPVRVIGGPHVMTRGVVTGPGERPGELLVAADGSGAGVSVPARFLRQARRKFDFRQPRNPHSGEWIAAGQGLANHLHGKQVIGRHINGEDVAGTYAGGGFVQVRHGAKVPVTHVRPAPASVTAPSGGAAGEQWRRKNRLPLGPGPMSTSGAVTDYTTRALRLAAIARERA